ncbi:serine hydrolase domain-containing protein [Jannaschia seohaensis]|uniref:CubicO group peptidase (Beta-lactamase class C family) n=1 Tax=Jannaschia seohaensis TaxID=475081 RepID=A0A2Y9A148_9RHOB|nr:serine hydrolase domain-containing protein [Jannaschia seohaensis]PWJ21983.1 CubicO group peptidase (beta-lactamase class C family) [Jannaschia seohaensis]SSA38261.1 CubicO group peptidase, beta-lactamase class C family [Jannaschia seohaensis]
MTLQTLAEDAVARQDVPFVVTMLGNAGGITDSASAGDAAEGRPASEDTAFRIFSMTKLVGSLAAMILIDRGKLSMETEVASVLPDWDAMQVLDGWDGDTPRLRAPRTAATVRHLATHRSGLEYEFWNADMMRYLQATGAPPSLSGTRAALNYPLMFDPGERWGYGLSTDFLGLVVEAVSGQSITEFVTSEILEPLGMSRTAFEPDGMEDRLAQVKARGEDGGFVPFDLSPPPKPEVYGMGHCLYSTAPDYMRLLRMLLRGGELDGTRILSEGAVDQVFADQMEGKRFERMVATVPAVSADVDPFPGAATHGFGGLINIEDVDGGRRAGTLTWAGVLNTHWWADRSADKCGVVMTQTLPFVEPGYLRVYAEAERAAYAA